MPTDNPQFSPDGRWIAYTSSATGRSEVYVQSFPPGHGKWTVSRDGGTLARWRGDGKELFYSGPDGAILSVAVKQRNGLEFGAPVRLFDAGLGGSDRFAVSPDGQRFVYPGQPTERAIIVVSNWLASVKR
jgi:Tol biopolymer transport system component